MNEMGKDFEPIAIVGIGCRFPGANDPEAFWQLLRDGVNAITEVPANRWDIESFYDANPATPFKMNTRWGGFLEQVDQFDPQFFGISPREAVSMDPKQRLLLEVCWEALEDAGQIPERLAGTQTGVFIGISSYDYYELLMKNYRNVDAYAATGNNNCIAAHRISYVFDFTGPSMAIDTACSSSLVAVHLACQSLWNGESSMALAGGVHVMLSPWVTVSFSKGGFMAADGLCKVFDARADGYVRGEGAGVVVLKLLSQAIADGDEIYAVIKGSAVNQDGRSNGLTAPNPQAQSAVLRLAYRQAGVSPEKVSYIEAHGTGTKLGDPMEMKALGKVLAKNRHPDDYCAVGSVKSNIGHLEAAAGIAGLIKVALSLKYRQIPPSLHFQEPNPYINFQKLLLRVQERLESWSVGNDCALAGVSSFGFGGTNAHVVLEAVPGEIQKSKVESQNIAASERPLHLLTLSAKSEDALRSLAQLYQEFLVNHPENAIADICFTANTKRSHFDYRLAVVTKSTEQLREQLGAFVNTMQTEGVVSNCFRSPRPPKVAFLFTGQGSQYVNMGWELYQTQPIFRQTLDQCNEILRPYLEQPLLEVLYPNSDIPNSQLLDETAYTQPALFAIEYALAQLWKSWGVEPDIVMGHSVGEYVAACVAGVFNLEDSLKLIASRGRLMQNLPQEGEMVAVNASQSQVEKAIQHYTEEVALAKPAVGIAAINGAQNIVISGQRQSIKAIIAVLEAEGIKTKQLQVSHAFHSPLMQPMLADFKQVAADVIYSPAKIKLVSNVTGQLATAEIATPEYWCHHVLRSVKFATSMETLAQLGYEVFVEIGPKPTLLGMGRQCLEQGIGVWLPSLRQGQDDWQQMLQSLAELSVHGVQVDWSSFDREYLRCPVKLPTYPFQRQRYWIQTAENSPQKVESLSDEKLQTSVVDLLNKGDIEQLTQMLTSAAEISADEAKLLPKLLQSLVEQHQQEIKSVSIQDWLYEIKWQPKPRQQNLNISATLTREPSSWLIFADPGGVGDSLAELLQSQGQTCFVVYADNTYKCWQTGIYSLNPANPDDFKQLLQDVAQISPLPLRGVVHLWSLASEPALDLDIHTLERVQILGCASTLHLVQALVKHNGSILPRLWLVTQGAQPVESQTSSSGVAQAPLWGLGKVIALEHPQLWGGLCDLAVEATQTDAAKTLLTELCDAEGEDHLAFRSGQRYVARLVNKGELKSKEVSLKPDAAYLITGGLGALGLKVARWMVEQGARHLILLGRRGVSSQTQAAITDMEQLGANILVTQADVSNHRNMVAVFEEVSASMPPLRGIVHAAGVLEDGILLQQDWERFTKVMNPKIQGAWNLHTLSQNLPLDFFVCFSSVTSLLGAPGQGNYAAANAFLDVLTHYRQILGLPGLSLNWGQWADEGMAASLDSRHQNRLAVLGISRIGWEQGLQLFQQLLGQQGIAQIAVFSADWSLLKQHLTADKKLSLLAELLGEVEILEERVPVKQYALLQQLETVRVSDRQTLLIGYIQNEVAKLLGLRSPQLPDPQQGFFDMGMDSLMALELKNCLDASLGTFLPSTLIFEFSNIKDLAEYLVRDVLKLGATSSNTTQLSKAKNPQITVQSLSDTTQLPKAKNPQPSVQSVVEPLSEDEVDASIAERLEKLEKLLRGNK